MKRKYIIGLAFVIWKIIDVSIAYIAHLLVRYPGHFNYGYQPYHLSPYVPPFLLRFANYDGVNYLHIARDGYGLYMQAYFPLFPILINIVSPLFRDDFFLAGFFIANISFFFGLLFLKKYLEIIGVEKKVIAWVFLFLLAFPMSFFFGAVYTEGLFFLLVTAVLYFSQKKLYVLVVIVSILAALTRLMGVFLFIPLVATLVLEQQKFYLKENGFLRRNIKMIVVSLSPLLGLFIYMGYLYFVNHDPFYFYHAVSGFHTGRTTNNIILLPQVYYRYLAIFLKASPSFVYLIAVLEFVTFNFFLCVLLFDLWQLGKDQKKGRRISLIGLNIFSLINLILPTLTGTMTSLPRYALFSLSFFLTIARIRKSWVKVLLLTLFIALHFLLLVLFIQGFFVS